MSDPLNPVLYRRLQKAFGQVRIMCQGGSFMGRLARDPLNFKRKKWSGHKGEEYAVCCPHCGDSRFRLWINHRWGTSEDGQFDGLVTCHNEHCEQDREKDVVEHLRESMSAYGSDVADGRVVIRKGKDNGELVDMVAPKGMTINMLPDDHPACEYVRSRGFSPKYLGETYGVKWVDFDARFPPNHHLFFPIYRLDEAKQFRLAGGQSRYFNPIDYNDKPNKANGEMKWFTVPGTRKSKLIYNYWRVIGSPVVVLGEGPLDACRIGPWAGIATFGKDISQLQRDLLWKHWGKAHDTVMVLAYDYDAWLHTDVHKKTAEKLEAIEGQMREVWPNFVRLQFTATQDVGATPTLLTWKAIVNDLHNQGKHDVATKIKNYVKPLIARYGLE